MNLVLSKNCCIFAVDSYIILRLVEPIKNNKIKKKLFTLIFSFVVGVGSLFASDTQVDGIYYDFDDTNMTASVTFKGSKYDSYPDEYTGNITIPASVNYNGKTYSVTSPRLGGYILRFSINHMKYKKNHILS